jgi:hypothetical protein
MLGDLLYEERPRVTEVVEYGSRFSDLMEGNPPGPEGARFDFHFVVDEFKGRLVGKGKGIVSLTIRPDGIGIAEIHETFTTKDGENILIKGSGISMPGSEAGQMKGKFTYNFSTSSKKYAWLNSTIGVGEGGGNPLKGDVVVKVYSWD